MEEQRKKQEEARRGHSPFVNTENELKRKERNASDGPLVLNEDELNAIRVRHS